MNSLVPLDMCMSMETKGRLPLSSFVWGEIHGCKIERRVKGESYEEFHALIFSPLLIGTKAKVRCHFIHGVDVFRGVLANVEFHEGQAKAVDASYHVQQSSVSNHSGSTICQ